MSRLRALADTLRGMEGGNAGNALHQAGALLLRPERVAHTPTHLQVEVATLCNLACVMCPRTIALARARDRRERAAWRRRLSLSVFVRIVDQFPALRTLTLHGIGEPLLNPDLPEMVAHAGGRGIAVRFTSNGTLLTPEVRERLIDAGLAELTVSMDGATAETYERIRPGARFAEVRANVAGLVALRNRLGRVRPRVSLAMVVFRENVGEAPPMVELAAELGVDELRFSPLEPPTRAEAAMMCSAAEWRAAMAAARAAAERRGVRLFVRGPSAPPPLVQLRPQAAPPPKRTDRCLAPWRTAVVTLDGEVMPCCNIHHPDHGMGNVLAEGFGAVWNGARYRAFRRLIRRRGKPPEPCRMCPEF
ncbi:MAG: radical SAM/SPASM domain-containing protein [Longimicrobiaceae bacterium]